MDHIDFENATIEAVTRTEQVINEEKYVDYEIALQGGGVIHCLMSSDYDITNRRLTVDEFNYSFTPVFELNELAGVKLQSINLVVNPDYKAEKIKLLYNEKNEKYLQVCFIQLVTSVGEKNLLASVYRGPTDDQTIQRFLDDLIFGQLIIKVKVGFSTGLFSDIQIKLEESLKPLS